MEKERGDSKSKSEETERTNEVRNVVKLASKFRNNDEVKKAITTLMSYINRSSQDRVIRLWNSLELDVKKECLKIRVSDLKDWFKGLNDELFDFVGHLMSHVHDGYPWKIWHCFCCDVVKGFDNSESLRNHAVKEHVVNLPPDMLELLPHSVSDEWIQMIHSCDWKPLNASASVAENQSKSNEPWPRSHNHKRAHLLKSIQGQLNMLIDKQYLADSHLNHIINLAKHEISEYEAGSQILNNHTILSVDCICILTAPQLEKVHKFLLELIQSGGLDMNVYKILSHCKFPFQEIKDKVLLNEDASYLLLDESLVPAPGEDVNCEVDPLIPWMFSSFNQWSFWDPSKSHVRDGSRTAIWQLRTESIQLKTHLTEKCELMMYDKALNVVGDLCQGDEKHSTKTILVKRRKELNKKKNKDDSNKAEIDTIQNLAKIDGVILKCVVQMDWLKIELDRHSCLDYRLGLLPLVKAFIQGTLVDVIEMDAKEKHDAAIAELAEKSDKNVKGATYDDEQHVLDTTTTDHSSAAPDEKRHLKERLIEIEAEKEVLAKRDQKLLAVDEWIGKQKTKLEQERTQIAKKMKDLVEEEDRIQIELEKHDEGILDPVE